MHVTAPRSALVLAVIVSLSACANGVPLGPADTSGQPSTTATTTTSTTTTNTTTTIAASAVAYTQDLAPFLTTDCVPCHGGSRPAAGYSMTTYTGVMAAVRSGSTSSPLVLVTQSGGAMYGFLSGDRATKATNIRTWVLNGAPQNR